MVESPLSRRTFLATSFAALVSGCRPRGEPDAFRDFRAVEAELIAQRITSLDEITRRLGAVKGIISLDKAALQLARHNICDTIAEPLQNGAKFTPEEQHDRLEKFMEEASAAVELVHEHALPVDDYQRVLYTLSHALKAMDSHQKTSGESLATEFRQLENYLGQAPVIRRVDANGCKAVALPKDDLDTLANLYIAVEALQCSIGKPRELFKVLPPGVPVHSRP